MPTVQQLDEPTAMTEGPTALPTSAPVIPDNPPTGTSVPQEGATDVSSSPAKTALPLTPTGTGTHQQESIPSAVTLGTEPPQRSPSPRPRRISKAPRRYVPESGLWE